MKHHYRLIVLCAVLLACNNSGSNKKAIADTTINSNINLPDWSATDSLEYIYYPNPGNQKVYKHQMISDPLLIKVFIDNLQRPVSGEKTLCLHYSKAYLFANGEVYKTLYISDSCGYLAFEINSKQYFINLTRESQDIVDSLEKSNAR